MIPNFQLFGETSAFPDVIHHERIRDRARLHDWKIGTHRHTDMVQLFHMERGAAEVRIDGQTHRLQDGELLYIPVHAVHGFAFRQGSEGGVFSFPLTLTEALPAASGDLAARLTRPLRATCDAAFLRLLVALVQAFEDTGTFRASLLASLGQAVLISVAQAALSEDDAEEAATQRRMGDFVRFLREDLSATRGVGDYARAMGITTGHLNRICRAASGVSVSDYIEAARMTEARRLLAFTQLSIAEIGYRLGYTDPSYFSRRFRSVAGLTPSVYRQQFLA
ncbi:helix-turn-helix domain-containing protein [Falsigemmobacter faecalis]|uniref:helix-turn-helix domain-containing protein n=1 Tax=Falsigemmobacter faecalis TaxID=2488730 RepID=UPI0013152094|nr:helix-turn-helix domain-containing protein [Falsigemmobacter faecalis]